MTDKECLHKALHLFKRIVTEYDPSFAEYFRYIMLTPIPNEDKLKIFKYSLESKIENQMITSNSMKYSVQVYVKERGIGSNFIWGNTPEGHIYWANINAKIY